MAAGERAPAIVQHVVVLLSADLESDELVIRGALCGFAARNQVGARAADGVLDQVREEERQYEADYPAQDRDVRFVGSRPKEEGPEDEEGERESTGVDEEPDCEEGGGWVS